MLTGLVTKKIFLSNVNGYVGDMLRSRVDFPEDDGVVPEDCVCNTYTQWFEEWIEMFNTANDDFKLKLVIGRVPYRPNLSYMFIPTTPIISSVILPNMDAIEDEEFYTTESIASSGFGFEGGWTSSDSDDDDASSVASTASSEEEESEMERIQREGEEMAEDEEDEEFLASKEVASHT
jgi:hypothetical protein